MQSKSINQSINQSIIYLSTQAAIMTWNKGKNESVQQGLFLGARSHKKHKNKKDNKLSSDVESVRDPNNLYVVHLYRVRL